MFSFTIYFVNVFQIVQKFLSVVKTAYMTTAAYMQKKMPLDSMTLQLLSAHDPVVRGHSQTGILLKRLARMMDHSVPPEFQLPLEVVKFNVDSTLPPYKDEDNMVKWWGLNQILLVSPSIFHGPIVKSSFIVMGDITAQKSMNMATFNAIQTTNYIHRSRSLIALQMFQRHDVKWSKGF